MGPYQCSVQKHDETGLFFATMDMGVRYAGLEKFSCYLDMPVMTRNNFIKYQNVISDANMCVVNDVMCVSAQIVRNVYKRLDPSIDESGVMDLMMSFGGSWMTQGHSSLYDIGCVVEMVTGLVIDHPVAVVRVVRMLRLGH